MGVGIVAPDAEEEAAEQVRRHHHTAQRTHKIFPSGKVNVFSFSSLDLSTL